SRQNGVPVGPAVMMACASEGRLQSQLTGEGLDLSFVRIAHGEDLLNCDDVRIQLCKHVRDAFDRRTAIHSTAFVNGVRHDCHTEILPPLKSAPWCSRAQAGTQSSDWPSKTSTGRCVALNVRLSLREGGVYVHSDRADHSNSADFLSVV